MKVVKKETPKEDVKFIVEDIDDLKEDVTWLAEDILDLEDDVESIRFGSKMMLDIVVKQDEQIKDLEGKFDFHDVTILVLFIIFLLWNLVLTYNVFF